MTGSIQREGLALVGALVGNGGSGGPLSPTVRLKLSLTVWPCASVAVTVIGSLAGTAEIVKVPSCSDQEVPWGARVSISWYWPFW